MADWRKIGRVGLYSVTGASLLAFGVWYYFGTGGVQDANALRATFARQQLVLQQRELQKHELNTYLTAVQREDEAALELAARRYGLVGENEFLWKVVPEPADTTLKP